VRAEHSTDQPFAVGRFSDDLNPTSLQQEKRLIRFARSVDHLATRTGDHPRRFGQALDL